MIAHFRVHILIILVSLMLLSLIDLLFMGFVYFDYVDDSLTFPNYIDGFVNDVFLFVFAGGFLIGTNWGKFGLITYLILSAIWTVISVYLFSNFEGHSEELYIGVMLILHGTILLCLKGELKSYFVNKIILIKIYKMIMFSGMFFIFTWYFDWLVAIVIFPSIVFLYILNSKKQNNRDQNTIDSNID